MSLVRKWGSLIVLGSLIFVGTSVSAQSVDTVALLQKLAELKQQLQLLQQAKAPVANVGGGSSSHCIQLSRTLALGADGEDVSELQTFLQSTGDYTYPEITGHFGRITQAAVQAWQAKKGIVSSGSPAETGFGVAGQRTRASIQNENCSITQGNTGNGTQNFPTQSVPVQNNTPTTGAIVPTLQPGQIFVPTATQGGGCNLGGVVISNNSSRQFFSQPLVGMGQSCSPFAQERQCINGILTGSSAFQYASCSPQTQTVQAESCHVGNIILSNGQSQNFFAEPSATLGATCVTQVRTCSNGELSGGSAFKYTSCAAAGTPTSCKMDGVTLQSGDQKAFFESKEVPFGSVCISQNRICTNGVFSGEGKYQNATCKIPSSPGNCVLDGVTVKHGQSALFFSEGQVLFGQDCTNFSAIRKCNNGELDGDASFKFKYASCYTQSARSCQFISAHASTAVPHGNDARFYTTGKVAYNQSCEDAGRSRLFHCNDGQMNVDSAYTYDTCAVTPEKSCTVDGVTVAGSGSRKFYSRTIAPAGHKCAEYALSRNCVDGVMKGSATYGKAVCALSGHAYCKVGSTYVADGKSMTAYSKGTVPFGAACDQFDQVRTCKNGVLSGSFTSTSCNVEAGAECSINGIKVAHNSAVTLYSDDSPASGETCAQNSQQRFCFNGALSGSDAFNLKTCTNPVALSGSSNLANALSALEAVLRTMTSGQSQ